MKSNLDYAADALKREQEVLQRLAEIFVDFYNRVLSLYIAGEDKRVRETVNKHERLFWAARDVVGYPKRFQSTIGLQNYTLLMDEYGTAEQALIVVEAFMDLLQNLGAITGFVPYILEEQ